jgi:hypothetical protein
VQVFEAQAIPTDVSLLSVENYKAFLTERRKRIAAHLNEFLAPDVAKKKREHVRRRLPGFGGRLRPFIGAAIGGHISNGDKRSVMPISGLFVVAAQHHQPPTKSD